MSGRLQPIHLSADSLWSRHGFMDGSPFEFEDRGQDFDDEPPHEDWTILRETMDSSQRADLLELLVRRHLLPAITDATGETPELARIVTAHNPVRDARMGPRNGGDVPATWTAIGVDVTRQQALAAAARILGDRTKTADEGRTTCA